ncbi:uncharacterized protein LOC134529412 isoform X2 [Bacillus rossius redtenbacheri]|uniref:uncharacterized protein LOC134529412 isoform X2 n=1 Tax=Bacillus rossius redtenbacheri TaxID=93214 RepID=UPI002FDEBBF0
MTSDIRLAGKKKSAGPAREWVPSDRGGQRDVTVRTGVPDGNGRRRVLGWRLHAGRQGNGLPCDTEVIKHWKERSVKNTPPPAVQPKRNIVNSSNLAATKSSSRAPGKQHIECGFESTPGTQFVLEHPTSIFWPSSFTTPDETLSSFYYLSLLVVCGSLCLTANIYTSSLPNTRASL